MNVKPGCSRQPRRRRGLRGTRSVPSRSCRRRARWPRRPALVEIDSLRGHIATRQGPVMVGTTSSWPRQTASQGGSGPRDQAARRCGRRGFLFRRCRGNAQLARRDICHAKHLHALAFSCLRGNGRGATSHRRITCGDGVDARGDGDGGGGRGLRRELELQPWVVVGSLFLRESGSARSFVDEAIEMARSRAALGILPRLLNHVARDHAGRG